jgi:hypothetical protein
MTKYDGLLAALEENTLGVSQQNIADAAAAIRELSDQVVQFERALHDRGVDFGRFTQSTVTRTKALEIERNQARSDLREALRKAQRPGSVLVQQRSDGRWTWLWGTEGGGIGMETASPGEVAVLEDR